MLKVKHTGALDPAKFSEFMNGLLETKSKDLYRSKGVLAFKNEEKSRYVFQGVHEQINFNVSTVPWAEGEEKCCKVVFIGRDLNKEELTASFEACFDEC